MVKNRQWRLISFPSGRPEASNWELVETEAPEVAPGHLLVKALYLDVAPYMRGRISPQPNYAAGVGLGEVMVGGAVGRVLESRSPGFAAGDLVVADFAFGWQEYAVLSPGDVRRIDPALAPLPYWLDLFGLNGLTAYFALFDAGAMKAGDTVLISAAAGSVGQIAGQLAKLAGCRAVAVTSSAEKAAWCREAGYDAVIDYRAAADLPAAVAEACPQGVDLFLDNTAGPIHDAAMQNLALDARVVVVGTASLADTFGAPDTGPRFLRQILVARATVCGFLFSDYAARHEAGRARLRRWYEAGRIHSKFDIAEGIASMPDAFLRLLTSRNLGKQLVRLEGD
ncbi:NADP-dependent oxidoreductase [Xanthobacter dioxanivorans]|uniref:NADP-dependent oxidoreductase n=1 Tax=Xanthobacter dioxanivorans TaxID=2528964 RepID=A0A974SJI1_9HYPH|nr:NADP-dependent oxidoreductase [Xanthobacter dioxanivorans]QRG07284.1 NADP-dependent oxidoreductase [Xanthobacter dioxanivorans]